MMRPILIALVLSISGCCVAPILAFEVTCSVTAAALHATDPNYGSRVVSDSNSEQLFASVADGARSDEGIKEDVSPLFRTTLMMAKETCVKAGAGPDTDCVDYLAQPTDSY